jgi:hypothetical protein
MKNKFIAVVILLGLILGNFLNVSAQTEPGIDTQQGLMDIGANEATVTFADMGFRETTLVSPFDSTRLFFSIPPNWRLAPGGTVQLDYEITLSGADANLIGTEKNPYGGFLSLTFNNQLVSTIALNELGPHTMQFQLPPESLASVRQDGRHQLTIALNAQFTCLYDIRAMVTIKPTSLFKLPFEVSSPELNLSRLPAPFYLRNALVPDQTLLVVPNDPDPKELKAALNVMAGFGAMIGDNFNFDLVTAGEVTEDNLAKNNLIFVGRPEQFDLLGSVKFPLAVENKKFVNLPAESQTDGVLEMAVSPWNESKAVLLVSGTSTDAVVKAAQALSSEKILVYSNPALAYVADVQLLSDSLPVAEDFTLQDLGYKTETLSGIGVNSVQYLFNASKEQLNGKDPTIDLLYYHSGLIDFRFSSFNVELNSQVINSTAFADESRQLTTLQLKIPPGMLRFGENRLTISTRILAITSCDITGFSDPWLTISDQTKIHLPTNVEGPLSAAGSLDLKAYPNLFTTRSDLGDVAFVLPKSSPSNWKIASQMAYNLGIRANPLISDLEAVYADNVPQQILTEKSLIVIGRASTVPLLSQINDKIPAPFDLKTDTAAEGNVQVVYRIPSGMSVGYLELLNSPYNSENRILVLAGNSDEGVALAGNTLLQDDLNRQLTGVFAVTNGTQIATGNATSPFSVVGTLVPQGQAVVTTPVPVAATTAPALQPPAWLMPVLIASGLVAVLVILIVAANAFSRRREEAARRFTPSKANGNSRPKLGE